LLVRGSLINELREERDASAGEVAMFFAISNFTTVNRAALFAAVSQSARPSGSVTESSGA
jgi:hypothetical protein